MTRGFMDFVATILIPDFPGETSKWYAEKYLYESGNNSDAKDPVQSLANTLEKQVREGRDKRIMRIRIDGHGPYRFFPTQKSDEGRLENIAVQISLSKKDLEGIDNLVALGNFNNKKFTNRKDVIQWLVEEAIKANSSSFCKVADVIEQIEKLKRSVQNYTTPSEL